MKNSACFNFPIVIIVIFLSFYLSSCKSTQQVASNDSDPEELEEMDEEEFFGESGDKKSRSRPEKKIKEKKEQKEQVRKVIKTARSYIGTPYKYGGTTRAGMDCSGLLCTTFRSVDVTLPRTSAEQSNFGQKVSLEDIREGDLVFFAERKGSKRVTHVGMVTEVNGSKDIKFIHSSSKLGVIETDLYSPYFIKIFVKATRPL